ncbi:oxaloacetate decarboxylase [Williamsia sp. D3]|uniref:isocitrate lyase/PEP mutase family protein n=1 Tax=Williamsia sp. D3 TaxID=1313067 RepID=UPI0003D3AFB4|nr:oxaloacetate decarboxylase [Williamsia sp. D3]ETD33293.1 carboxyvinyl-carboxyphosphonate phosphorylmutase [Williamsia sp. D3]
MAATIKSLLERRSPLVAPGAYDGISALLIRELGFDAAYIGSFAVTAAKHGLPDIGFASIDDMAESVRCVSAVTDVPIIVDGEGGFGNALHVARTVRVLERAGASATHIEDHSFGKHLGAPKVIPVKQAVDKIKAAVDARASEDFLIIGRSDAETSEGQEATVDRLLAYQEAGADILFMARALRAGDVLNKRLVEESKVPILITNGPNTGYTAADLGEQGASIVLYPTTTSLAAESGMRRAFEAIARDGSTAAVDDSIGTNAQFEEFVGTSEYRATAERIGLLQY